MNIGVGITTFNRFSRFKECFENLVRNSRDVTEILIVDDCSTVDRDKYDAYFDTILVNNVKVIVNKENSGVAVSKNKIMKYFYDKGYDYFFTLEDDINIISPEIFKKYIEASQKTGIHYFNFGLHGYMNIGLDKAHSINNFDVTLYPQCVGAFSLYTPKLIEIIGYHDEKFKNAWEHVEYCYRASKEGLTTPFWQFIDIKNSHLYIQEQKDALEDSSIRPREDWAKNIHVGQQHFIKKHGVGINEIPRP
jgi:GT2 family glycosyltransferase